MGSIRHLRGIAVAAWMVALSCPAGAVDLDKLNKIQSLQQQSALGEARRAAAEGRIEDAESLLRQARGQAYNPSAVAEVEKLVADARAKRAEEERRRAAAEEERRQAAAEEEQRRQAAASAPAAGRPTGGDGSLIVQIDNRQFLGIVKSVTVKGTGRTRFWRLDMKNGWHPKDSASAYVPLDIYDFDVTVEEDKGGTAEVRSYRLTGINHACRETWIYIYPESGISSARMHTACR